MKNQHIKHFWAVPGYLWGTVLLSLAASLGISLVYRMAAGGLQNGEHLVTGLGALAVQLASGWLFFARYGYRRDTLTRKELCALLAAGGLLHLLVSVPLHFNMYTGGTAALYLTEYVYRLCNPELPVQMPFTDIPLGLCTLGFLAVEAMVLATAYAAARHGQAKRQRERELLTGRPA